jgi:adenine-specific DNA-methyltransferase
LNGENFDPDSLFASSPQVDELKKLGRPFFNWAGKAERLSFDVPTLPLFVHERLSTKAFVETLVGHRLKSAQEALDALGK